uniref:Uncharacterized protein n=1 Tax=Glossina brevipalpis TaxID=37001 RepID=A0A1A9WAP3_9MUSC
MCRSVTLTPFYNIFKLIIYIRIIWLQLILGFTLALHSTEALMAAGFLKSQDLGGPPHGYGGPHPHHSVAHGPLPPGMGMPPLGPFSLPHHTLEVGFPQENINCIDTVELILLMIKTRSRRLAIMDNFDIIIMMIVTRK